MHYEMMFFTSFVVIHHSQDVDGHMTTVVSVARTSGVHDTCSKVFVIVLNYNMMYHISEMAIVLVKTIVGDLYVIIFINDF